MRKVVVSLWLLFYPLFASTTVDSHATVQEILYQFDLESSFADHPYFKEATGRDHYTDGKFLQVITQGSIFLPTIKNLFKNQGIPEGFAYMPVIESEFRSRARSHAGAQGIWQLVPQTARSFGLKVNKRVDERKDPIKSTYAIARYLKHLERMFGKWYLVALAYSCGEGTLKRAIARAGSDKISVLLDEEKKYLPRETREHFKKLMTVVLQANNERIQELMADRIAAQKVVRLIVAVKVKKGVSLAEVAKKVGMSVAELSKLNPHLQARQKKGAVAYSLNIPSSKADLIQ